MQFLVTAFDYPDGFERRMEVREKHLKLIEDLRVQGICLYAARLTDANDKSIGSVMIFDYPSRKDLDAMLKDEPYTKNRVWEKVQIVTCDVAPKFLNK